jgi:hypothetical protein
LNLAAKLKQSFSSDDTPKYAGAATGLQVLPGFPKIFSGFADL